MSTLFLGTLQDGSVFIILTSSFIISFRYLNFPDLSLDASYALGMAALGWAAVALTGVSTPALLSLALAVLVGATAGCLMVLLNTAPFLRIGKLLAGLIVGFSFFAWAFRLNGGATTRGLYRFENEVDTTSIWLAQLLPVSPKVVETLFSLFVATLVLCLVWLLCGTRSGLMLRACGHRPDLLREMGGSPLSLLFFGMAVAGGLGGVGGWLQGLTRDYANIGTFGTFLYALAGLYLGERVCAFFTQAQKLPRGAYAVLVALTGGILIATVIQVALAVVSRAQGFMYAADIRLVIAIIVLAGAARMRGNWVWMVRDEAW